jgi:transposase
MGAVEHLETLCCLGLPPASAMLAVTPVLHEMRLIPPIYVKPYIKRGNSDAAAIEPRPRRGEPLRFVPVKSAASQATLMLHQTRGVLIKQRP